MKPYIFIILQHSGAIHEDLIRHHLSGGDNLLIGVSDKKHDEILYRRFTKEIVEKQLIIVELPNVDYGCIIMRGLNNE